MNKHPLSHTQHTAGQPNMKQEERKKRETKTTTEAKVYMLLSPTTTPPPPRRTTIAIRADLIEKKGIRKLDLQGKEGRKSNHM